MSTWDSPKPVETVHNKADSARSSWDCSFRPYRKGLLFKWLCIALLHCHPWQCSEEQWGSSSPCWMVPVPCSPVLSRNGAALPWQPLHTLSLRSNKTTPIWILWSNNQCCSTGMQACNMFTLPKQTEHSFEDILYSYVLSDVVMLWVYGH